MPSLAALILTGGTSSRMGADKASTLWGELRAVDRVAELARALGAERVITVGGGDFGLEAVPDPVAHGGPVAGLLAGLAALGDEFDRVIVLAVDAPTVTLADLEPLLASPGAGASYEGLPLPMVLKASAVPQDAEANWPLRRFVERTGLQQMASPHSAGLRLRGANTPGEREALLREAGWD